MAPQHEPRVGHQPAHLVQLLGGHAGLDELFPQLTDVDTSITSQSWPGGTAGALLIAANIGQLREEFIEAGVTAEQLDEMCRLVTDPRLVLRGHFTYSTMGRRADG